MHIVQRALADAQSGRLRPAIGALERLVQKKGAPPEAHHFLGMLLARDGRPEHAIFHLERACRMAPGRAQFESNFGNVLLGMGREEEAMAHHRAAIAADGAYAPARIGLSGALLNSGRLAEAEAEARRAVELAPEIADAAANLASSLIITGRAGSAVVQLSEAIGRLGPSVQLNTLLAAAMHYDESSSPGEILEAHRLLGRLHAAAARSLGDRLPPLKRLEPGAARLRVGYLSVDFRDHPVGMFIEPALVSDETVEVFCYDLTTRPDAWNERLRGLGATWRDASAAADGELAAMVRRDGIDILVELSGHTLGHRQTALAARMAPVQVSYLGYPATTGNPMIDARLVDCHSDPPGNEAFCTERLIRLDPCAWCFGVPAHAPAVGPLPAAAAGAVTFGSFNNLAKTTPAVLDAWAELLQRTPDSRLVLKNAAFRDEPTRARFARELAARGVGPDRLGLLAPTSDPAGHLAAYGLVDIGLDPFPYAGTTTTCEALWMGVPVVTLAGTMHAGRVGVSLLNAVGLEELVAPDIERYTEIAAALAADLARLGELRAGLRERLRRSKLMDASHFRSRLHGAYAALARDCSGGAA
jgi:predicted O-linked N-acetylglucosamine transferase (SPINDLY family)